MKGQWIGSADGTNKGSLLLNLDERPNGFSGTAVLSDADDNLPGTTYNATLRAVDSKGSIEGHADLQMSFDKRTSYFIDAANMEHRYPGVVLPRRVTVTGTCDGKSMQLTWQTNIGTNGTVSLALEATTMQTLVKIERITWDEYKSRMVAKADRHIFRGQNGAMPLRTSFHRVGRYDVTRFAVEDLHRINSAVSSTLERSLNTSGGPEMIALLGIAQHHGYPTPLLDWTKSPYIAAYFACRDSLGGEEGPPTVFGFDRSAWVDNNIRPLDIGAPLRALTFFEPIPMFNPRVLQQQSVLMLSNVDNIEQFVIDQQKTGSPDYLSAWELTDDPRVILRDLRIMGVYAGSMFPGLDGMCRGAFEESIELT